MEICIMMCNVDTERKIPTSVIYTYLKGNWCRQTRPLAEDHRKLGITHQLTVGKQFDCFEEEEMRNTVG